MEESKVYEVKEAIADPSTVGLASFGIGLLTVALVISGVFKTTNPMAVIVPLAFFVGIIHFFATYFGFRKNELFTALVFGGYGLFWVTFAFINLGPLVKWWAADGAAVTIFFIVYTVFTFYIWISTFATNGVVWLTLTLLLVLFLLLDFGQGQLAGYVGIVDALLALYLSAGGLLGAMFGRPVLPVFPFKK